MKKYRLPDLVPPWADATAHLSLGVVGLVLCSACSFSLFYGRFHEALRTLYHWDTGPLREGVKMKYFAHLICGNDPTFSWYSSPVFLCFHLLFLGAICLAVYNYSGFRNGSKSCYLMRRLPDRWEYHRRCLALPLLTILAALVLIPILIGLCYAIYLRNTPEQCLQPDQWEVFRDSIGYLFLPVHLRFWEVF